MRTLFDGLQRTRRRSRSYGLVRRREKPFERSWLCNVLHSGDAAPTWADTAIARSRAGRHQTAISSWTSRPAGGIRHAM